MLVEARSVAFEGRIVCPDCGGALKSKSSLECLQCRRSWELRDGMPVLTAAPAYFKWAPLSTANYNRMMDMAATVGWKGAVERIATELDANSANRLRTFTTDESRADWRMLLPVRKDWNVLDVGAGWGPISVALARRCNSVVSMDACLERAQFLRMRSAQDGLPNITVLCGGNTRRLPVQNEQFDLVVLNGVLEWTATTLPGNPMDVHRGVLSEVLRVLKPGGWLYLGIENRFGYPYLLGKPDNHSKLVYGNVLPRRIAQLYSRIRQKQDFRTYTHSYSGLNRLLRTSGFSNIDFFWPYPAYSRLNMLVPLSEPASAKWTIEQLFFGADGNRRVEYKILRNLARFGLLKYFVREFSVIAQKLP